MANQGTRVALCIVLRSVPKPTLLPWPATPRGWVHRVGFWYLGDAASIRGNQRGLTCIVSPSGASSRAFIGVADVMIGADATTSGSVAQLAGANSRPRP